MAHVESPPGELTLADLVDRFGPLPAGRILTLPVPGTATEQDVIDIHDREHRLCELVDGVLLEKTVGYGESYLAAELLRLLGNHVKSAKLGIVTGEAGMIRLFPGLVRIPDAAFASRERFGDGGLPKEALPSLVPDLAVEVLSRGNTAQEMARKLDDYFDAGVRLVWYVDPRKRTVQTYTGREEVFVLGEHDTLTGGDVLPGFSVALRDLFADPLREAP